MEEAAINLILNNVGMSFLAAAVGIILIRHRWKLSTLKYSTSPGDIVELFIIMTLFIIGLLLTLGVINDGNTNSSSPRERVYADRNVPESGNSGNQGGAVHTSRGQGNP